MRLRDVAVRAWRESPPGRALLHRRLLGSRDPAGPTLATAIRRAARDDLDAVERRWVERIATWRAELNRRGESLVEAAGLEDPAEREETRDAAQGSVGAIAATIAVGPRWGRLLLTLVRETRPERCLELGTGLGVSAAYITAALALNDGGHLTTCEGSAVRAAIAERELEGLGCSRFTVRVGTFASTLPEVLEEQAPISFAYIDGHHDEDATVDYFAQVRDHAEPGSVLVFDDIAWSAGMRRAWRAIVADPATTEHADVGRYGICVVRPPGDG